MIEELVRDLTKVGSISKSEAKARILAYTDQALQQRTEEIQKAYRMEGRWHWNDKMVELYEWESQLRKKYVLPNKD